MKKSKKVEIKNSRLRKIRNNLRKLIESVYYARLHKIHEIRMKLLKEEPITSEEKAFYDKFAKEEKELSITHNDSILFCPLCKSSEKDMVFQPYRRQWLCVECFDDLMETYEHRNKSKLRKILEKSGDKELHINMLEDILEYDKETLKKLFREWGFKVQKIPEGIHVIVPEEDKEQFLRHLDELVFPW